MKIKFLSWLAALSFGLLSWQAQADMITDAHGNVGYDTAAECDAAVHNGSAKFYQPFTRKSPLKQKGEKSVKTAQIRDLGEQYAKGACDVGVGHKLGRDGVSTALQGKFVPYSPDMPINAYLNAQGEVVRVSMGVCDNWFSDSIPRPVGDAPQAAVSETPAAEPVEVAETAPAPAVAKTGVRPYVFGTVGVGRGEMTFDANAKTGSFKDSDVQVAGQVGAGVQLTDLLGAEVFYQANGKRKYQKDVIVADDKGQHARRNVSFGNVRTQTAGARLTVGHNFTDKFRLFGKVGAAYVDNSLKNTEVKIGELKAKGDGGHERGARLTFGAGALYQINDKLALRADYDHHFKKKNVFRCEDYLGLGVQYRF